MASAPPRHAHPPTAATRLKRLVPWAIAVVAMTWVLRSVIGIPPDPAKLANLEAAFRHAPYGRFLTASLVLLIVNCAADSFAMLYTFRWFGCRLPYRELFIIRAATYLFAVVQYYVGQLAIVHFLHTRRGVPAWRAGGWILFISGINMGVLVLLAAVGLIVADVSVPWLRLVPAAVGVGAVLYGVVIKLKPASLARITVLAPLFEAGVTGHIKAVAVRLPHIMVLIVWHYLALRWFGVDVSFGTALVLLPAVFFAAALPISVQGLGMSQMAAIYFFGDPGHPEATINAAVLAYSLAMTTVSLVIQIGLGLAFLQPGKRLGLETDELDEEDDLEPPAAGLGVTPAVTRVPAVPAVPAVKDG